MTNPLNKAPSKSELDTRDRRCRIKISEHKLREILGIRENLVITGLFRDYNTNIVTICLLDRTNEDVTVPSCAEGARSPIVPLIDIQKDYIRLVDKI